MDTVESRATEKRMIEALAVLMRVHFKRDECGDSCIQGRSGASIHVHGLSPAKGFCVMIVAPGPRSLRNKLAKLAGFTRVTQRGDCEACLHMPSLPTVEQAAVLCEVLHCRKLREYSDGQLSVLQERGRRLAGVARTQSKQAIQGPETNDLQQGARSDGLGEKSASGACCERGIGG